MQSSEWSLLDQHGAFDRERAERLAELLRPSWHREGGTHWPEPSPLRTAAHEPAPPPAVPSPPLLLPGVLVAGAAACGILVAYASGWVHRLGPVEVSDRRAPLPTSTPPASRPQEATLADAPASSGPVGLVARAPAVLDGPPAGTSDMPETRSSPSVLTGAEPEHESHPSASPAPSAARPRPTAPLITRPAPPPRAPASGTEQPAPPKVPPPKPAPANTESGPAAEPPRGPDIVREAPF